MLPEFSEWLLTRKSQHGGVATLGSKPDLARIALNRIALIIFQPKKVLNVGLNESVVDDIKRPETLIVTTNGFKVDVRQTRIGLWG